MRRRMFFIHPSCGAPPCPCNVDVNPHPRLWHPACSEPNIWFNTLASTLSLVAAMGFAGLAQWLWAGRRPATGPARKLGRATALARKLGRAVAQFG